MSWEVSVLACLGSGGQKDEAAGGEKVPGGGSIGIGSERSTGCHKRNAGPRLRKEKDSARIEARAPSLARL